ncbi:MAG TPA: tetratricopeptide repeat protein [Nannocystis exedens]|nr:tetratricopeptide repeat protein [Nannocystis exedens]
MTDFIAALGKDPAKRRRRWLLWIAFGGALAMVAGLIAYVIRADAEACSGGDQSMSTVWNEGREEALKTAFRATGLAYSADVSARVVERLGEYRDAWIYSYREACLAHRRGERSSEVLDLQMACLRSRRREFDAVVRTFVNADPDVVERAVSAVAELTEHGDLDLCEDLEYLRRGATRAQDPELAARLEDLRGEVADAAALGRAGKNSEGLAALTALRDRALAVDEPMLAVEVALERGRLLLGEGNYEDADKSLVEAYYEARAIGHDEVAAASTIELLKVVTVIKAPPERAEVWIKQAEAEVRLLGRELVVADFYVGRAGHHMGQGAFERALDDVEEALTIRKRELPANHPKIAAALRVKGAALFKRGRNAEARVSLREALGIVEAALGPHHPDNADVLTKLALVAAHEGRFADGIELASRALEISERARGAEHPENATILSNLGELEIQNGDYQAAVKHLERAVAIAESVYGGSSVKSMLYVSSLAVARYKLGDNEGAEALMERAYMIAEASLGAEHPSTGALRGNLGEVLNDRGRFAEAEAHLRPALAVMRAALGNDRPELGPVQRELARALFGQGRRVEAEVAARDALALCDRGTIAADELAKVHLLLARILLADSDRGERGALEALHFVEMAGRDLAGHEANEASLVAELRALLRAIERARRENRGR